MRSGVTRSLRSQVRRFSGNFLTVSLLVSRPLSSGLSLSSLTPVPYGPRMEDVERREAGLFTRYSRSIPFLYSLRPACGASEKGTRDAGHRRGGSCRSLSAPYTPLFQPSMSLLAWRLSPKSRKERGMLDLP